MTPEITECIKAALTQFEPEDLYRQSRPGGIVRVDGDQKKPWKPNARDRIALAQGWFPCPGFIGDPFQRIGKFRRWKDRPQRAWRLYWKLRPHLAKMLR